MNTLGYRLKSLRQEKGLTQKEVAKLIGTTDVSIGRYEMNARVPKADILNSLAKLYDVEIDFLLSGVNKEELENETKKSEIVLSKSEQILLDDYRLLNTDGQKEANKRVKELTLIPFYKENNVVTLAAHNDHLNDAEEKDKIMEDFDDMDKW